MMSQFIELRLTLMNWRDSHSLIYILEAISWLVHMRHLSGFGFGNLGIISLKFGTIRIRIKLKTSFIGKTAKI